MTALPRFGNGLGARGYAQDVPLECPKIEMVEKWIRHRLAFVFAPVKKVVWEWFWVFLGDRFCVRGLAG